MDRSSGNTRRTGLEWIASRIVNLLRHTVGSGPARSEEPGEPQEPLARALFVAGQVLHDPTHAAFRLDDGSLLVLDDRMPRGFVAVASRAGAVIVRPLAR